MARRFDRPTLGNMSTEPQIVRHFDKFYSKLEGNLDDIEAMFDDDVLTPSEKPVWVFMNSYLTGEQADLDAKATTYGVTTEKTNYDNAVSALTTYLATLTSAVAWNDMSGNTTITGTTLRSKFNDVLTTKQALLNVMHNSAKSLADAAQGTADTAVRDDSISSSWTSPGTILTGSDAGTDATITIANHVRKYSNATEVAVTGGTITALAYSTTYYLYYTQTSKAGGSVAYVASTDPNDALPAAGRHYCGKITTPASGGGSTSGSVPPGGGGGDGTDIP